MNRHKCFFLFTALIFPKPGMTGETLEQAFAIAVNNNQRIIAAKADTRAAEMQLSAAQGLRLPQLKITTGYTQFSEAPAAQTVVGGRQTQFPTAQSGSASAQAMMSIPVFTSGRITHNIDAAEAIKQATTHNEATKILNIKLQVADAFIAVFRAEKSLEVAQSHVTTLRAHAYDVSHLYEQGMVARNDLLAAEVELSNAEQDVMQMENQLHIAKARFNHLLNRKLTDEVSLIENFPEAPHGTLTELSQQALRQRPELHALTQQINALEHRASGETANLLPQININGGYQYQENRYQAYEDMWVASATLQWKLFDENTRQRSHATKQQSLSLQLQRNDMSSQINLQVRQAWFDVQETQKRGKVAKQAIGQADENLKVSTERYQQGLAAHAEVLDAENLRIRTISNYNNARYDAVMAMLSLHRAIGSL